MNQKERMLAAQLYFSADPELTAERRRARRLVRAYNATTEEQESERDALLRELLGARGKTLFIETPFTCDYGGNVYVLSLIHISLRRISRPLPSDRALTTSLRFSWLPIPAGRCV